MLGNISNVCIKNGGVYLYYDITITEDNFKKQEQLDIYLSKIKKNILDYKPPIECNKTVKNYYEEKYEVYVLITFYVHKIITESETNNIQTFNVLYKFTDSNCSIITNESITFYKNKFLELIRLSGLITLTINSQYIKSETTDNYVINNELIYRIVLTDSQKLNEMKTVKFIEQETSTILNREDINSNFNVEQICFINQQNNIVDQQQPPSNGSSQLQPTNGTNQHETSTNEYIEQIEYQNCNTNYYGIKFSRINLSLNILINNYVYVLPYKTLSETDNECDSLYYHCENFIKKMNTKNVHSKLKLITGTLDDLKKKQIKKLFTDNDFDPNNSDDADEKEETDKYGNFGITKWNYNREYNALKYFYNKNGNNTNGKNPLKDVYSLMMWDYGTIVKYSHMKSIYQL